MMARSWKLVCKEDQDSLELVSVQSSTNSDRGGYIFLWEGGKESICHAAGGRSWTPTCTGQRDGENIP